MSFRTTNISEGPDGIRKERPHLRVVLEALVKIQVYVLAVQPISPSHGFIYLRNFSAFHSSSVVVLCYVGSPFWYSRSCAKIAHAARTTHSALEQAPQGQQIPEAIWLTIVATKAVAVNIPTPGISAIFLQAACCFCQSLILRSMFCISASISSRRFNCSFTASNGIPGTISSSSAMRFYFCHPACRSLFNVIPNS